MYSAFLPYVVASPNASDMNPTYHPPRTTGGPWPIQLDVLASGWPFVLRPYAALMPSGNIFLYTGITSILIDPVTNTVGGTSLPTFSVPSHRTRVFPYSAASVLLPLTPSNGYTATVLVCGGVQSLMGAPDSNPGIDLNSSTY